ncbi:MAG: cytidine deaminase [Acidobacteriaceae bacterium]|nr:cytidine deaminase [Acidobacteriaceae bacterium]
MEVPESSLRWPKKLQPRAKEPLPTGEEATTLDDSTMPLENQPANTLSAEKKAELRRLATEVAAHSYSPYSKFRVGAALLLSDGSVVSGCNVENCSYRLTSCAEQAAIARAVSERGPGIRLLAVAVANLNGAASMPCGACRQTLTEFGSDEIPVLYPGEGGKDEETTLGALIPQAFRAEFLQ